MKEGVRKRKEERLRERLVIQFYTLAVTCKLLKNTI